MRNKDLKLCLARHRLRTRQFVEIKETPLNLAHRRRGEELVHDRHHRARGRVLTGGAAQLADIAHLFVGFAVDQVGLDGHHRRVAQNVAGGTALVRAVMRQAVNNVRRKWLFKVGRECVFTAQSDNVEQTLSIVGLNWR